MSRGSRGDYPLTERNGKSTILQASKSEEQERLPLQEPVRLQPSWEESNLPEDELNFKNLTMEDASLQLFEPIDKYKLVYFTFILHGIGVLMPWNMFITAESYFLDHKLEQKVYKDWYSENFFQYMEFASQVPNVIFNWLNVFVQLGGNLTTRIVWSITIEVVVIIFTIMLAMSDSHDWRVPFFWVTLASVVVLNMANGIYQNTIFGMAAKLPLKYTGAVVLGSNICGTFTSVVSIFSKMAMKSEAMAAIYYFITALFVLLICFDTYFALPLNKFYRHYELKEKREAALRGKRNNNRNQQIPYLYIFKKAFPQLLNVFLIFFVTLSIFPAIQVSVQPSDKNFFTTEKFYSDITCFLSFNVCAMLGSFLTGFVIWPKPKYLWIPVTLRLFYIPFFLLCNYHPSAIPRALPVLINNDWVYWITAITMGLTSGYFSSMGMMFTPRTVEPQYATTAGMFGAAALISGIFTGIMSSFIWPWLVTHVGF